MAKLLLRAIIALLLLGCCYTSMSILEYANSVVAPDIDELIGE